MAFRVAVEALRILLARAQLDAVIKPLDQEGAWDKMKDPQQHTTGVTLLSRYTHLSSHNSSPTNQTTLINFCTHGYDGRRRKVFIVIGDGFDSRIVLEDT